MNRALTNKFLSMFMDLERLNNIKIDIDSL